MRKTFCILIASLFISIASFAQVPLRKCATMEHLQLQKELDPTVGSQMILNENSIQKWIENNQAYINSNKAIISIPVVVHVIYNTTAQNISDARVTEQLTILNRDYAGLNTHSMYGFASTLKVNTELQFCLAQRKPDGTATNGIERRSTTTTSFTYDDKVKKYSTGGLDAWDPTKYINIWVCNLGGGLCGYAQFPTSGVNSTFGVVIMYQFFGVTGAAAPYNLGGTTTHEIGHCFNLYHIWGDDNTACTGTDYCNDVPNQAGANYGVPTYPHVTCSNTPTGDMFMNFMDYSDDIAYANFTANQKARIQACFASGGLLYSLSQSNGCTPSSTSTTCDVPAGLAVSAITQTTATLGWNAVSAATSYSLQYRVVGATTWIATTSTTNSKALTGLTAAKNYEFQVKTVCASGSSVFSASGTFTTLAVVTSCTDSYETNNTLATAKTIAVNTNITALIGTSTDIDYFKFTNTSTQKNIKITLTNLPADYDVVLYKSTGTQLGISQNSNTTAESIVYNTTTVGTYYLKVIGYGSAYNTTQCYTLKAAIGTASFKLEGSEELNDFSEEFSPLTVYPNPASDKLNVQFNSSQDGNINIRIFDINGKMVMSNEFVSQKGMNTYEMELGTLSRGIYVVNLYNGSNFVTKKLIVEK